MDILENLAAIRAFLEPDQETGRVEKSQIYMARKLVDEIIVALKNDGETKS